MGKQPRRYLTIKQRLKKCLKLSACQRLLEKLPSPALWKKNVVDSTQFDINLEAEVGKGLRCGFLYILHLDTLRGHAKNSVSNTLHLSCEN